jgi:hypothetical protein
MSKQTYGILLALYHSDLAIFNSLPSETKDAFYALLYAK